MNLVEIDIRANDLTGPGFASVLARAEALKKALGGESLLGFDPQKIDTQLTVLKSKLQAHKIADLLDINMNSGQIEQELALLKRYIHNSGITDVLGVTLDESAIRKQVEALGAIPVRGPASVTGDAYDAAYAKALADAKAGGMSHADAVAAASNAAAAAVGDLASAEGDLAAAEAAAAARSDDFGAALAAQMTREGGAARSARALASALEDETALARPSRAALDSWAASGGGAAASMERAGFASRLFSNAVADGMPMWTAAAGRFGLLRGHVQLFGGALTRIGLPAIISSVSGLHLLTEAVIETAGTLIPAAVAFGVFGAAATPTVTDLYQQMKALHTASEALGVQMPGLSGGFSKMADAVQPQVYTLFGEALYTANHSAGSFTAIARGAGKVLDDLGARFAYAVTQGNGFNTFTRHAVSDLAGWGNLIGNIGGIFGNMLKVMPGYAEMLLSLANGFTHVAEVVTGSGIAQGILRIGLAAHGALFYIGLLSTGATMLVTRALPMIGNAALGASAFLEKFGTKALYARQGLNGIAGAAQKAEGLPWGWITVAAAGIGFLAWQFASAKDAAQQFNDAMQKTVQSSTLNGLHATLSSAAAQTATRLAAVNAQLAAMPKMTAAAARATGSANGVQSRFNQVMAGTSIHYANLQRQSVEYTAGLKSLHAEQGLVSSRVQQLAKQYGGTAGALAALTGAGITAAQITSKSSQTWSEAKIEVQAYQSALKETTLQDGRLGAAQNALNYVAGDSANALGSMDSAITGVVSAQQQLLGVLTGGEAAFTSFQQVIGGGPKGTGGKLTGMAADAAKAGASLNGLNTQSLTLANDFYSSVLPAAQNVVGALEMQNATSATVRKSVATMASEWGKYTGGNKAAQVATVEFINNALGPGTVSLKSLNGWVNSNKTSLGGFKSAVDKAQSSASKLAGTLNTDLNAMFAKDLLVTSGAAGALNTYAWDVTNLGASAYKTQQARAALIGDLEKAGYSAKDAAAMVGKLQKSVDKTHGKTVTVNADTYPAITKLDRLQGTLDAVHGKTVYVNVVSSIANVPGTNIGPTLPGHAMGGIVGHAASGGVRNGLVMVGELGPELVSLPQGSRVWPHGVMPPGMHAGGDGAAAGTLTVRALLEWAPGAADALIRGLRQEIRIRGGDVQAVLGS